MNDFQKQVGERNLRGKQVSEDVALRQQMMEWRTTAFAIVIDNRFFYKFGKKGQVLTAHTLAGARLFQVASTDEVEKVEAQLMAKDKTFDRVKIGAYGR